MYNAVSVAELAVERGAIQLLVPISARKQLNDLPGRHGDQIEHYLLRRCEKRPY